MSATSTTIRGDEKSTYLHMLDNALAVLAEGITHLPETRTAASIRKFGESQGWDWEQLPRESRTYATLASMVGRIRDEYRWFDWYIDTKDPLRSRGFFDDLDVSTESGLPFGWMHNRLDVLKREASDRLAKMSDYATLADVCAQVLTGDTLSIDQVPDKVFDINNRAMHRSFFEQLDKHEPLEWRVGKFSAPPHAERIMDLGAEELWQVQYMTYSMASSTFQLYVVDFWQEKAKPIATHQSGARGATVDDAFVQALSFGVDNESWYMVLDLDNKFESAHPVHVSRATLGPFESKYLKRAGNGFQPIPVVNQLRQQEPELAVLHFKRQYSFAPNQEAAGATVRQVVHHDDWSDYFLVVPGAYASQVAEGVQGSQVTVLEM